MDRRHRAGAAIALLALALVVPPVAAAVSPADTITGDNGNNVLTGTNGPDTIRGLRGNDTLSGRAGRDRLQGGPGFDILRASGWLPAGIGQPADMPRFGRWREGSAGRPPAEVAWARGSRGTIRAG